MMFIEFNYTILVGCVVIGDFQMDQYHLMFKVSLKSSTQDHMNYPTELREKTF